MSAEWDALVGRAASLGYSVALVEFVECSDAPGMLGQALGVCLYGPRIIRIREALREDDRCAILRHELGHAEFDYEGAWWHEAYDLTYRASRETRMCHERIAGYLWPVSA